MGKGGRGGRRNFGGNARKGQGSQVQKPKAESSVTNTTGPKPMDIDSKMSLSLDEIIKKEKSVKPKKQLQRHGKNNNKEGGKNKTAGKALKHFEKGKPTKKATGKARPENLRVIVDTSKIRGRPVLNQIISHAGEGPRSRPAHIISAPPRQLRDRMEAPIDYHMGAGEPRYNNAYQGNNVPRRHYAPPPSVRHPAPPTAYSNEQSAFYEDRSRADVRMRRY